VRSGHVLGLSHRLVVFTEVPTAEAVHDFAMDTGLVQWNSVEIDPPWDLDEAVKQANALTAITW
jgi:hypothetical protein